MIRVYADMVADLFHYGHVEFLRQVSLLGDYVMVGINSDDEAESHKRKPVHSMKVRMQNVADCQYVDEVIPNAKWIFDPAWIEKHNIDLVAHGDDYTEEKKQLIYRIPIERGIFRSVSYTKSISTTEIIRLRKEGLTVPTGP